MWTAGGRDAAGGRTSIAWLPAGARLRVQCESATARLPPSLSRHAYRGQSARLLCQHGARPAAAGIGAWPHLLDGRAQRLQGACQDRGVGPCGLGNGLFQPLLQLAVLVRLRSRWKRRTIARLGRAGALHRQCGRQYRDRPAFHAELLELGPAAASPPRARAWGPATRAQPHQRSTAPRGRRTRRFGPSSPGVRLVAAPARSPVLTRPSSGSTAGAALAATSSAALGSLASPLDDMYPATPGNRESRCVCAHGRSLTLAAVWPLAARRQADGHFDPSGSAKREMRDICGEEPSRHTPCRLPAGLRAGSGCARPRSSRPRRGARGRALPARKQAAQRCCIGARHRCPQPASTRLQDIGRARYVAIDP